MKNNLFLVCTTSSLLIISCNTSNNSPADINFGNPREVTINVKRLEAITGDITEAPSISFDGSLLYYHQKTADAFMVYCSRTGITKELNS